MERKILWNSKKVSDRGQGKNLYETEGFDQDGLSLRREPKEDLERGGKDPSYHNKTKEGEICVDKGSEVLTRRDNRVISDGRYRNLLLGDGKTLY